jgi:hypothetical protein
VVDDGEDFGPLVAAARGTDHGGEQNTDHLVRQT